MRIGSLDLSRDVLVVAEIGNNHEGDFKVAQDLVAKAAACGVGAVKFQTFRTERFVSIRDTARYERLRSFELTYEQFAELARRARSLGVAFISTPLDLQSAVFLRDHVDAYKVASGDNNFYPLLDYIATTGKPVIISSGLSDLAQISRAYWFVRDRWRALGIEQDVAVLHCVSSYPVAPEDANVASVPFLADKLGGIVGYSDHTIGLDACLAAIALGARIIEKHFTLDKDFSAFRDHKLSADPPEMAELVRRIALVRTLLGRRDKVVQPGEAAGIPLIRRSIAAAAELPAGHVLRWDDLMWIRPADGLPPGDEWRVLGRPLRRARALGDLIGLDDID